MKTPQHKIEVAGKGLGIASSEAIHNRAQDLAEQDGRDRINPADLQEARREITDGSEPAAPELPSGNDDVTPWDETRDQKGHQAPTVLPEDENQVGAVLVEEGLGEAEQDRRRAAKTTRISELE